MSQLAIPRGFYSINEIINTFPLAVVAQIIDEAMHVAIHKVGAVSADAIAVLLKAAGHQDVSLATVQSVISAITYTIALMQRDDVSSDDAPAFLQQQTELSPDVRETFTKAWRTSRTTTTTTTIAMKQSFRLGNLVGLDWTLRVGVASSHCKALKAPLVTLALRFADASGKVTTHPVELTYEEFQEFSKTFRDIHQQLESV